MSPDQITELELRHLHLKDKIKKYFQAKDEYFKSKDSRNLIILKKYEKEIKEMISPEEQKQKSLFDLAQ